MLRLKELVQNAAAFGARFRNPDCGHAFETVISADGIRLSVGGGPRIVHPRLINLNIEPGENIHLVGDAHAAPIRSSSIDAIYSEAVIEHLEKPELAVAEMFRVAKPGALVLTVIPFIQIFHGYPSHFQNYTLHGHRELIRRGGFEIIDSGSCVGPTFALLDLASNYLREYLPTRILSRGGYYGLRILLGPLCVIDRYLVRLPSAHIAASATYVLSRKP